MSPVTFKAFLTGPDAPRRPSQWHPALAIAATVIVFVLGQITPIVVIGMMHSAGSNGAMSDIEAMTRILQDRGSALLLLTQCVLALLTIGLAGRMRSSPIDELGLVMPASGVRIFVYALALMVPIVALINLATYTLSPESFIADFNQFAEMVRGQSPWLAFAAIGIAAPLWEEMLFRGFLLPSLSDAWGFWPGAILVSAAWTALHFGYSVIGLAEVFLIGLFFAWLYRRTGSLWVPIACHGIYNSVLFLALRFMVA